MWFVHLLSHCCPSQEEFTRKRGEVANQQNRMTASSMSGICPSIEPVVQSVSGQAKLTRNCSKVPLKISDGPRIKLDVQLEEIPIVVSDRQYALLVMLLDVLKLRARASKFRKWWSDEKGGSEGMTARKMWKFALRVTMENIQQRNVRCSIGFALKRARQNVTYVAGYMRHLTEVSLFLGSHPSPPPPLPVIIYHQVS